MTTYAIGPRATPTIDEDRVYTLGAEGDLHCLRLSDGRLIWAKDFKKDYNVPTPNWGFASPPLVDQDRLICIVGGESSGCVAFDKHTGRELWRSLTASEPGYSAPVIRTVAGHRQLLIWTATPSTDFILPVANHFGQSNSPHLCDVCGYATSL